MDKIKKLKEILKKMDSAIVAFSGGMDSSFLLKIASDVLPKDRLLAVTAISDTYTRRELEQAKIFVKGLGVRHRLIFTDEMENPFFVNNPPNRCYYCKKELFGKLREIARDNKINFIIDGSNMDDLNDYRPGSRAKKEFGIRSPLEEAMITKKDIMRYSKKIGLDIWRLPTMPCLASRIPYGEKITRKNLRMIEKAEDFIMRLGIKLVRVRLHRDIARIEVDKKDIKIFYNRVFCDKIIKYFKRLGFNYITLDLEGYRTGSLNEVL